MPLPIDVKTSSFRTGSSFALPEVLRRLGHEPEAIFAEAGVDLALYDDPENRIDAADLGRLFSLAADVSGRQDIALLAVDGSRPDSLGMVGEVVAQGPDVHTSLRNLVRLLAYNTYAGYPVLSVSNDIATIKFELRDASFAGSEFVLEGATGILLRLMQALCGADWRPSEVHLARRESLNTRPFEAFFAVPVRFSATEDALLFAAEWLDHPVPFEQRRRKDFSLEISRAPFSELVRQQVARRMGFDPLSAEKIAHALGLSRRQLFRSLAAEGTGFQTLVDEFRFARARHLLAAGDAPLVQIAVALGFPEHSAFSRGFSRWSGMSPAEWRRQYKIEGQPTG